MDSNYIDDQDVVGSPEPAFMDDANIDLPAKDPINESHTLNTGDTTQGTESISTSVALVTPSVLRKTVKPIHPSSKSFRCDNESATHEHDVHFNCRGTTDGKITQGEAHGLNSSSVYLEMNHDGRCKAKNVDTTPDRTSESAKMKRIKVDPNEFKDFPTRNGVCLKFNGAKGISKAYRDRRNFMFEQMKCGRAKPGEKFPNAWIQKNIIEHLLMSLQLDNIRFFAIIHGKLREYLNDEIFNGIRADFATNTDNYEEEYKKKSKKTRSKKSEQPPVKRLVDLFNSNRIELDNAIGIDQGKVIIYQGIMKNILDAFARRILDEKCERELYEWCELSFAFFFKHKKLEDGDCIKQWLSLSALMKSTRPQLKQEGLNRCKTIIYEGILDDIGYAAVAKRLSDETEAKLHVWAEKTWRDFFDKGTDKKRKYPPNVIDDQNNGNSSSQSGPHDDSNRPEDPSKHSDGSSNNPSDQSPGNCFNSSNSSPSNAPTESYDSMNCDQSNDSFDDDDESSNTVTSSSVCSDSSDDDDYDDISDKGCEVRFKRRIIDNCTSIIPHTPVIQCETLKNTNSSHNAIIQRIDKMDMEDIHEVDRTSIETARTISLHDESLTMHLSYCQRNASSTNQAEVQKKAKCLLMDLCGVTGNNATKTLNVSERSSNLAKNQSSTKNNVFKSMHGASADVKTSDSTLDYDESQSFCDATETYLSRRNNETSNETFIAIFDAMLNEVLLLKHRNELVDEGTRRCTYAFIDYGLKLCSTMDPDAVHNSMVDKVIVVEGGSLAETESMTLEPESFNGVKQTTTMSSSYISSIVHESTLVDHDVVFDRGTSSNQNVCTLSYMHYRDLLREDCKHQTSHGLKQYVSEKLMNFVENSGCRFLGEIPGETGRYYVLSREQALMKIANELRHTSSNGAKVQLQSNLNSVFDEKRSEQSRTTGMQHHPSTFVSLEVEVKEDEQHLQKPRSMVSADDEFMNSFSGSISSLLPPQTVCHQKRRPPIMNDSRAVSIDCCNSSFSNSFTMDEEGEQEEDVGYTIRRHQ